MRLNPIANSSQGPFAWIFQSTKPESAESVGRSRPCLCGSRVWACYVLTCGLLRAPVPRVSCSVAQSCPTLRDPMDCSMPRLPVHHHLLEFTQTHVHRVNDAIQPSHPLSSPSPPAFSLSQHQGLFKMSQLFASGIGVSASASVLPMNTQGWFPLGWTGWISLQSRGLSRVFSNTTIRKHQFFHTQPSLWSNSHILTWLRQKP